MAVHIVCPRKIPVGADEKDDDQYRERNRELVVGGKELRQAGRLELLGQNVFEHLLVGVRDQHFGESHDVAADNRADRAAQSAQYRRGEHGKQQLEEGEGLEDLVQAVKRARDGCESGDHHPADEHEPARD